MTIFYFCDKASILHITSLFDYMNWIQVLSFTGLMERFQKMSWCNLKIALTMLLVIDTSSTKGWFKKNSLFEFVLSRNISAQQYQNFKIPYPPKYPYNYDK